MDVAIIGAGCAGLSAAIYCSRADLKVTIFSGDLSDKGGLLVKTSVVENYPGFPDGIIGYDLIHNMELQAKKYGATVIDRKIVNIKKEDNFILTDDVSNVYGAKCIIIATGSKPNKLYLPNEDKLWGKGISSCCVCDGFLYKKKKIVVCGGGDSALEEALFLTKFSNVTLIHRRDKFRASAVMQKRLFSNPKITIIYDSEIIELIGDTILEAIIVKNLKTDKEEKMKVDGLFYGLGLKPNTSLFTDLLEMENGYIKQFSNTATSISGIYSAGDVSDEKYRQAVVACGEGCKAALDAISYIENLE